MSTLTIEQVINAVQQVPSLSAVVMEVLASFGREDLDAAVLAKKLGQDQGLAARVLRVANSPFYGLSSKVGSIGEAVVVLGFHNLSALVAAAEVIDRFPASAGNGFDRTAFWQHGIGTGVCARVLAQALGRDQAMAFSAGLLHDVGRLVLDTYFHENLAAAVAHCKAGDSTLLDAEQAVLGLDHAQVGYELARRWKFPHAIQQAIRDHHQPEREPASLTDLVHVANVLCHALDIGNAGYDVIPPLSGPAWARLGLEWGKMPAMMAGIETQYASISLLADE